MLMSFGIAWWLVAATGIESQSPLLERETSGLKYRKWCGSLGGTHHLGNNECGQCDRWADGLAGGSALMGFGAFMIISYWTFRNPRSTQSSTPRYGRVAASFAGHAFGFSVVERSSCPNLHGRRRSARHWSGLGLPCPYLNTHLLLILICGINVVEAGSVAIQMGVFKLSGRKRRLFKMSPIHTTSSSVVGQRQR